MRPPDAQTTNISRRWKSSGILLDEKPNLTGLLSPTPIDSPTFELCDQLTRNGYIFFRGLLDRETVHLARMAVVQQWRDVHGELPPSMTEVDAKLRREIALNNSAIRDLSQVDALRKLFERLLGGEIRRHDFIGLRIAPKAVCTRAHCDRVYYTRGTELLLTAWIPLGDVPVVNGGLTVLEGSNNHEGLRQKYCTKDVDTYCINRPDADLYRTNRRRWTGELSRDLNRLSASLGGRWLSNDYRAGDVLVFSAFTVHASLDNQLEDHRFSCDVRFQLKSDPVDHRYVGKSPLGNSLQSKRGIVC